MKQSLIISRSLVLHILWYTSFLFINACSQTPQISQEEFLEKMKREQKPLVLDVRSRGEYAQGHIAGAVNVPISEVTGRMNELMAYRDQEIIIYCRSGNRASSVEAYLLRAGFTRLLHLSGDMISWVRNNRPLEQGAGTDVLPPLSADSALGPEPPQPEGEKAK